MKVLAQFDLKTVDVGANIGDWSTMALKLYPQAKIHAFEIVPQTFAILKNNIQANNTRIVLNNFGLLDGQQTIDIKYAAESNGQSSMFSFLEQD